MTAGTLVPFLLIVAIGAYVQTMTGFAFGLIVMGGVGLTGILSLPEAAIVVSLLTLVNAAQVLAKGWRDVARRELLLMLAASIPALFAGYALLEWMAETRIDLLRAVLGIAIIVSGLQLLLQQSVQARRSPDASFLAFGSVAGVMGGLFSTSGPPVVYHMYRQPFAHVTIRETLVTVFAANALIRLGIVGVNGALSLPIFTIGLSAAPVVVAFTYAARRWPPRLTKRAMRGLVFVLLVLSGLSLAAPSLLKLMGAN